MRKLKKIATAVVSLAIASAMVGCTPTIGNGTSTAMTVDGYDVPAGLFIYYSMQGYSEASSVLSQQNSTTPELKDVKNATIDSVDSTDWIQNKATDYCVDFITIIKEFDEIGGELSQEDIDSAKEMAAYYWAQDSRLDENGVSLDTMESMAQMTYKEQAVFKHYYGFDGTEGCTEEELKDYFDENFARIKYVSISLTDDEGNELGEDEQRELRKKAESYARQVNSKYGDLNKMHELDAVSDDYDEYLAQQTTVADDETAETTTTTTTTTASDETTTTTTTDPYANERLFQKVTTTTADESVTMDDTTTEAVEESDSEKSSRLFSDFVFNELEMGKAEVYDYDDTTIYIVMRADLRERMTEDDYWSEDYVNDLLSLRYYDTFIDMLEEKSTQLSVEKNDKAYRRYEPFKLVLETTA
ncbi:MAG: hypothetical protein NC340_05415 [Ruminococcus flavefaciens]|nr:hypothetical protein [Ruminococcus flavefaciens]MCM1229557.1 hypothetical protein [Ruminococcus flavefaciens]